MRRALPAILLFLSLLQLDLYAQYYPFRNYSIQDGLSESVVNAIIQDSDGYIWMGTGFGLNRFDGNSFVNYFEEGGLSSGKIWSLYESSDGKIWVGTDRGVNYVSDDSIFTDPALVSLNNSSILSIFEDESGHMWFGTDGDGVWHYTQGNLMEQYSISQGFKSNEVRAIVQEPNTNAIWFATRGGLTRLLNGNLRTFTTADGLPENRIRDLVFDDRGFLWIATRNGLSMFTGDGFITYGTEQGLVDVKIQTLSLDPDGNIWVGTEEGIAQFKGGSFTNYTTENGLANKIINTSITDREGNLWFGTYGGGASQFLGDYFENFDSESGLSNNLVTSITEDEDGKLWIATYGGGLMTLSDRGRFEYFSIEQGLLDDRVYHLSTDSQGRMWIGMRDGLGYMKNGRFKNFSDEEFPFRKVRDVMEGADGNYWISTYDSGLVHMHDQGFHLYDVDNGLPSNTVVGTVQGDDGALWVATYGGVARIEGDEIQTYTIAEGLPNNGVMTIIKDDAGTIWVSTFGGVAWFDGVRFVDITPEDGLPSRVCYFIKQDSNGIFWIGTSEGIAQLDVRKFYSSNINEREQAIQIITQEQGLVSNETNLGAVYEDHQGHLWFGTVEGVSHFRPDSYRGNQVSPLVHILELTASGREYVTYGLVLPHNSNFLEISFTGINLTAPNQVEYEYLMSGIDPDWQRTTDRIARYPSMPPGDYYFRVRARNSNGIWSERTAVIHFNILPPFWLSWWFLSLIVLSVAGIIYLFYRNYQYMQMVDIERMRVRIASDLHDDVGASLTEIALQSDFLQASSLDSEFKNSLSQIGKQCRRIVTALDDIVWSIDARNDTLGDLTDRMQDYILNVLEPRNFNVSYDFEELKMENKLPVPVKENLYLIFKEAVNNIAKYSNGNVVKVKMYSNNDDYEFLIYDNGNSGKGLKKTGHGLRNMEMRAQRIGGKFDFNDEDGFTIMLSGKLNMN